MTRIFRGYYALRWKILERDKFTCQYCGQKAPNVLLEVDHVIPVENGGTDDESNLITACWACNRGKNSLAIITKSKEVRKNKPYEGVKWASQAPTRDRALVLLKQSAKTTKELAQAMNITYVYARQIIARLLDKQLIVKIPTKPIKWGVIMKDPDPVNKPLSREREREALN